MTSGNSPNCVGLDANIGDNVREYANLNKPFLDSIAEHGVLVPLTAIRRPDGVVEVRNGQRRTMAARKVGLSTVPVYVLAATAADTAAETIDRIVHQIVTNDQKQDLSNAQRARGIQQMIDAGLSATKVAKKLSVAKDTVKAAEPPPSPAWPSKRSKASRSPSPRPLCSPSSNRTAQRPSIVWSPPLAHRSSTTW